MTAKHRTGTQFHSFPVPIMLLLNNPTKPVFLCTRDQTAISLAKHQMKLLTRIWGPEGMKKQRNMRATLNEARGSCPDSCWGRTIQFIFLFSTHPPH